MSDVFSSRLRTLLGRDSRSQKEICAAAGIGESALVNYKKGRIPKSEELFRLAGALGVSMEYLLTGKGGRTIYDREPEKFLGGKVHEDEPAFEGRAPCRMIPVLDWSHAGGVGDNKAKILRGRERVPTVCLDPEAFALRLEGDSMQPAYQEGDLLVVMPGSDPIHDCLAVVRLTHGLVFRRMDLHRKQVRLIPLNTRYAVGEYDWQEIVWSYPVWGSWRQTWR